MGQVKQIMTELIQRKKLGSFTRKLDVLLTGWKGAQSTNSETKMNKQSGSATLLGHN